MRITFIQQFNQKRGVVLLMTLIVVMLLIIIGGSILFSSLNQSTATQSAVDDIKAEQLAKGLMWKKSYDDSWGVAEPPERIDSKECTPTITGVGDQKNIIVRCP